MFKIDEQHKHIYEKLQDEESRELYMLRYNFYKNNDNTQFLDLCQITDKYSKIRLGNQDNQGVWDLLNTPSLLSDGVILYGSGNGSQIIADLLDMKKVPICAICDSMPIKHGGSINTHQIISLKDTIAKYPDKPFIITPFDQNVKKHILNILLANDISNKNIYFGLNTPEGQYFGVDFIKPLREEIYIDGGCYDSETILNFIHFAGSYEKIYAFEPDSDLYNETEKQLYNCKIKNVNLFQKGLWDKTEKLSFRGGKEIQENFVHGKIDANGTTHIETVSIDDVVSNDDAVTFIKFDIEGAELRALQGAKKTILKHLPRLAISIYHKPEDIVEIPAYILSLNPNYRLYVRHHSYITMYETVLYAL